ncbi:MarR family winged helix-turn-helix transcriptional regulator [Maribacter aestuarii]|uniref:MarR family winged helix-turn-helix transcriptional regulator n=1 Tax=Maribacter aestuarii TaxID=1130723 RepID=UPI0025A663E0|nr:MarR family transcriptional regulator [Maribacter aestuarii]
MDNDLVKQLGYANLDTRLKRISDKMSHSLRAMYRDFDMDTEPNWYLVLWIVNNQPNVSVMEIANRLKFTHQSVMNMTSKMINKGYLKNLKDPLDKRKTIFNLTKKAEDAMPLFTKIWEIGKKVTLELLNENTEIMPHLEQLEANLEKASFGERIANELVNEKK